MVFVQQCCMIRSMKSLSVIHTWQYCCTSCVYNCKILRTRNINKSHGAYIFFSFSFVKKLIFYFVCNFQRFNKCFFFGSNCCLLYSVLWSFQLVLLHCWSHFILVAFSLKRMFGKFFLFLDLGRLGTVVKLQMFCAVSVVQFYIMHTWFLKMLIRKIS